MKQATACLSILFLLLSPDTKAQSWKIYYDSARFYQSKNQHAGAITCYEKADEILFRDSIGTASYANNCKMLAAAYASTRNYEKAEEFFQIAYETWQKLSTNDPEYAKSCNNLGAIYFTTVKLFKAEVYYKKGKEAWERISGRISSDYARSCFNLGNVYSRQMNYPQAENYYLECRDVLAELSGKTTPEYAMACDNLSRVYRRMEKFDKAIALCKEAKTIREKVPGRLHLDYAESCANLALLYSDISDYSAAERLGLEALDLRKQLAGVESEDYASSCNDMATLYSVMENFKMAEYYYVEARRINRKILPPLHPNYALSCNNLGEYYRKMGQYLKAEELYMEAKEIFEKVYSRQHYYYAVCSNNLGITYAKMERFDEAEAQYLEAKEIMEKVRGKENQDYAGVCENLAGLYAGYRKYDLALALNKESKDVIESVFGTQHDLYAQSCSNTASIYVEMGNYPEAEAQLAMARNIIENLFGRSYSQYIDYSTRLGSVLAASGRAEQAFNLYQEAFTLEKGLLHSVFQYLTENEKQQYISNVFNRHEDYFSFALRSEYPRSGTIAYNIALADRTSILASSIQVRAAVLSSDDSSKINLYNRWIEAREKLGSSLVKPIQERKEQIKVLEEEVNNMEKSLVEQSADFRELKRHQEVSWESVRDHLKEGESAIEFVDFQYKVGDRWADSVYYLALLIKKDSDQPEIIKLFEESELEPLLKIYKGMSPGQHQLNFLYSKRTQENNTTKSLYDIVWKNIEPKLQGINTVYFSPAGLLHKLAFAAIPLENGDLLSDRYQLVQLNTTSSLTFPSGSGIGSRDKILLYGGVQYSVDSSGMRLAAVTSSQNPLATRGLPDDLDRGRTPEFTYLAGTDNEVSGISKLAGKLKFEVALAKGRSATEESFKKLSGASSPAILHFATHGFFFPDPKKKRKFDRDNSIMIFKESSNPLIRSGLALAGANNAWKGKPVSGVEDGILTAYEVSNMYLPKTKLAVLSACETGLGDIQGTEGVYGLQRAFKMAGVENLIMSLWKVPDVETAEFMQDFYKNLFSGQTIGDAFYHTQRMMKNKYRNDPYKWAAWVLVR